MARLKTMPGRTGAAGRRLGPPPTDAKAVEREREALHPWRAWYRTGRWRALRRKVLKRAGYVCEQTGTPLIGKHPAPNSPVIDHIEPHKGDAALFWDEANLQAVSKAWHDSEKQSAERRALWG